MFQSTEEEKPWSVRGCESSVCTEEGRKGRIIVFDAGLQGWSWTVKRFVSCAKGNRKALPSFLISFHDKLNFYF